MSMTKRHFIELANYIKDANEFHPNWAFSIDQQNLLASFCKAQNPRFNRERWLDYIAGKCGPSGGKR